jgi:hypothetical protein
VRVLRRKRQTSIPRNEQAVGLGGYHRSDRHYSSWAAGVAGEQGHNATVFYSLLVGAGIYAVYDVWRFLFPAAWPFFPRLWFYEHLVKMLSVVFSRCSCIFRQRALLPSIAEPWKQLWPTLLFHNLMIGFIL